MLWFIIIIFCLLKRKVLRLNTPFTEKVKEPGHLSQDHMPSNGCHVSPTLTLPIFIYYNVALILSLLIILCAILHVLIFIFLNLKSKSVIKYPIFYCVPIHESHRHCNPPNFWNHIYNSNNYMKFFWMN